MWLARSLIMSEGVVARPDQVSVGVLVSAVPRDAVDAAVAACGVGDKRSGGKLPAHVMAYLTMGLCLFADDDYTEVATKVTGSLTAFGCWDAGWSVPTTGGITQARKRLGSKVLAEVFEQVAGPVANSSTRGAWLRRWRLVAIDGFEVDVPDTKGNAAEFGYAGSGDNRSAFCKARVVALAKCGTHAFLAAEVGGWATGEKTLANRLYQRLRRDELCTADRNFYSFEAWRLAAGTGAALLWRAPTGLGLPIVKVLADGTYLTVLINPAIRGARRRAAIMAAAREIADGDGADSDSAELDPAEAHLVRVVEYDVPDRDGNGTGELIVLLSTIGDPADAGADELAAATTSGGRKRPVTTSSRRICADQARSCARACPSWSIRRSGPGYWSTMRSAPWSPEPPRPPTSIPTGSRSSGSCVSPAVPPPVRRVFPPED